TFKIFIHHCVKFHNGKTKSIEIFAVSIKKRDENWLDTVWNGKEGVSLDWSASMTVAGPESHAHEVGSSTVSESSHRHRGVHRGAVSHGHHHLSIGIPSERGETSVGGPEHPHLALLTTVFSVQRQSEGETDDEKERKKREGVHCWMKG
ncbi:hypothetical protein PMAYCL1PPCAC_15392, partial [Pristionchus mayeri]